LLVFASNNPGKLEEIKPVLMQYGITVAAAGTLGFNDNIEESGKTFAENAIIKAKTIANALHLPALADDSGLCVDVLGGAPGILSARFSGINSDDAQNNHALLLAMRGKTVRSAHFMCVMACACPNGALLTASGRRDGIITTSPKGNNGFGYDPIFMVSEFNCTLAELELSVKNTISHRAQALKNLLKTLPEFLQNNACNLAGFYSNINYK
jgi:XTP/dITP diphosphohydrolase